MKLNEPHASMYSSEHLRAPGRYENTLYLFLITHIVLRAGPKLEKGWSGGNMGPRPLGVRRNRWAACASRQGFFVTD